MIMNERIEDLQDFVGQLGDCVPPKSLIQRKNVLNRIRKAKEVTDDIKELVNAATEENINLILSALIDQSSNLPSFVKSAEHMSLEYKDSIYNIMEVFETLLTKYKNYMANYLIKIKDAVFLLMNVKDSKLRQMSYSNLCHIVYLAAQLSSGLIVDELKLPTLFEQLFLKMCQSADSSTKVRKHSKILMGYFARHFPNLVSDRALRIITQILYEIENEMRTYNVSDNIVIGGCIEALSGLFTSFKLTINSEIKEKVHNYLLLLITKGFKFKTRYTPRACLEFFCEHSSLFGTQIERDYREWFSSIENFALHSNKEDSKSGCNALISLFAESTRHLGSQPNSLKSTIMEFYVLKLRDILEAKTKTSKKLKSVAIKAMGDFSFAVTDIEPIFDYLFRKSQCICSKNGDKDELPLLPVYIEALGHVLSHHTVQLKMEQKHRLQTLCSLLFSRYLEIYPKEKSPSCRAVAVFFIGAQTVIADPVEYADFIGEIVWQGLVRSSLEEYSGDRNLDAVDKYAALWTDILNFSSRTDLSFGIEKRIHLRQILDEQFVKALSNIIRRLDLSAEDSPLDANPMEVENCLHPVGLFISLTDETAPRLRKPNDWLIFHNLVKLVEKPLLAVEPFDRLPHLVRILPSSFTLHCPK